MICRFKNILTVFLKLGSTPKISHIHKLKPFVGGSEFCLSLFWSWGFQNFFFFIIIFFFGGGGGGGGNEILRKFIWGHL